MARARGFTLIELMTVIAIIAILSAIILPVLSRAKDSAYRSTDMQHLSEIRAAIQLYRIDQGAYPPAILGYASVYMSGPNMGLVIPANDYPGHLYNKRIPSLSTLQPVYNDVEMNVVTKAFWPNQDPRTIGSAPILDLDGDGDVDTNDDLPNARQRYGPTAGPVKVEGYEQCPFEVSPALCLDRISIKSSPCDSNTNSVDRCFYRVSGFDVGLEPDPTDPSTMVPVLRYARFWTVWGIGDASPGNAMDDPRQLGYEDPPDSTVLTWNSFFRDYDGAVPKRNKRDQVLFIGGGARYMDSLNVFERSWRVMP